MLGFKLMKKVTEIISEQKYKKVGFFSSTMRPFPFFPSDKLFFSLHQVVSTFYSLEKTLFFGEREKTNKKGSSI